MKILKSISKETGKVLFSSKVTTMVEGKLTTSFLSKEELSIKTYNTFVDEFEIIEVKI